MRRPSWVAVFILVPLAGCSTGPDAAEPAARPTISATAAQDPVIQVMRADTMHLLDPPHVAGLLPTESTTIRTPIPSDVDELTGGMTYPTWNLPPVDLAQLRTAFHLVVDVQGVVTPYGYSLLGAGEACFWNIAVLVQGRDPLMYDHVTHRCLREGPAVAMGVRVLEFDLPEANLVTLQGEPLAVIVWTSGVYGPGATIDLLSGSVDADSTLTIERLQLPVTTMTLLA